MSDGKLWVLFINFQSGEVVELHEDEQTARDSLYDFVKDDWVDQFGDWSEFPEGRDDAIREYFANTDDGWYYLQPHKVVRRGTSCPPS